MEELLTTLHREFKGVISSYKIQRSTEIEIIVNPTNYGDETASVLKQRFLELLDANTIVAVKVIDQQGNEIERFASNQ